MEEYVLHFVSAELGAHELDSFVIMTFPCFDELDNLR